MLSAKRMRAHLALFGAVAAVTGVVAGLGVGLTGYLADSALGGVRSELRAASGDDLALQVGIRRDEADPAGQDERMRALLARQFRVGESSPYTVTSHVEATTSAFSVVGDDGAAERSANVAVRSDPSLRAAVDVVAGSWPADPGQAALQADAAEALGLAPGDRVRAGDAEFEIAATWRVADPLDPRWLADPLLLTGEGELASGPLVVDESTWGDIDVASRAKWTLVPRVDELTAADLEQLPQRWQGLAVALREDRSGDWTVASLQQEGSFARTAARISGVLGALQVVQPIALLVVAALAVIALLELARLLADVRRTETTLLWSRGATPTRLGSSTALETLLVAGVGAALGAGAATAVLFATGGSERVAAAGPLAIALPVVTALTAAGMIGGRAGIDARRSLRREDLDDSGRGRTLASVGGVALLVIAAAVATSQLLLYGSPVTPVSGGGTRVDPLAVLAPVLTLLAVALLGLVLTPLLAPVLELRSRERRGIVGALAARGAARRLALAATPVVLVGLAIGQIVVASGYAATWGESSRVTREMRLGAPVLIDYGARGGSFEAAAAIRETPGVTALGAVRTLTTRSGSQLITAVAVTPSTVAQIASDGEGVFDPESVSNAIRVDTGLPRASAGRLEIGFRTRSADLEAVSAVLIDERGFVTVAVLDPVGATDDRTVFGTELALPIDGGDWSIAALDLTTGPPGPAASVELVDLRSVETAVDLEEPWTAISRDRGLLDLTPLESGIGYRPGPRDVTTRLLPGSDPPVLHAVISRSVADQLRLQPGIFLPLEFPGTSQRTGVAVAAVTTVVPGSSADLAVLVDATALLGMQLRTSSRIPGFDDLWGRVDDPAAGADLGEIAGPGVRVALVDGDSETEVLGSSAVALTIGAVGAALLALLALGAVTRAQVSARASEIAVLRALGVSARQQAAVRTREVLVAIAWGVVAGVVAGVATTLLTISAIARAAIPDPLPGLPTVVRLDPAAAGAGLVAFGLAVAAIVVAYGVAVRRQATGALGREDGP